MIEALQQLKGQFLRDTMANIRRRRTPIGRVAFNMRPVFGPWGGAGIFLRQIIPALKRYGFNICFDLKGEVDVIFVVDPRSDWPHRTFGVSDIRQYRKSHPKVRVIHRVNECDKRKGTDFMDESLASINSEADHTVFISEWLKEHFSGLWFDAARPHSVIYNGADPLYYHPVGGALYDADQPLRLVTHHWSDNPMKGFPIYEQLDDMLANGELPGFEFWLIGRWPANIKWKATHTLPPAADGALGDLLRQCHLYLTASLWEPCGAHHVEGAQCGLPLIYHEDGGGIVEAGRKYGLGFCDNLGDTLVRAKAQYGELRQKVMDQMPNGDAMCLDFARVIMGLMVNR